MAKIIDLTVNYLPIKSACKVTGLSEYYIRKLLKANTLPHIRVGENSNAKVLVNMRQFTRMLDEQSRKVGEVDIIERRKNN